MSGADVEFTVFTKAWRMPLPELGELVAGLGFAGVEFPVRPGFQVEPDNIAKGLPEAARILGDFGVRISSVAGSTDEPTIAACAEAGVGIIRTMARREGESYLADEAEQRKLFDSLVPALEGVDVKIGVQNHCGKFVGSAIGIRHLIESYDPANIAAVWDPAHCSLAGEPPELAIDILWSHLCLVNLKNGIWRRTNEPEAEVAEWKSYWTSGRGGLTDWAKVVGLLERRGYTGDVCMCAEYSDGEAVERLTAEDLAYARSLFA